MTESSRGRNATPHPLWGVPKCLDGSPFEGAQIAPAGRPKSRRLELYDRLSKGCFEELPAGTTEEELEWLERFHRERLAAEREERKMHFGAFALVAVLFFGLLPALVAQAMKALALDVLALLLLTLVVPYVFVYFGYENRVRAMALGLFRLMEARALHEEERAREREGTGEGPLVLP